MDLKLADSLLGRKTAHCERAARRAVLHSPMIEADHGILLRAEGGARSDGLLGASRRRHEGRIRVRGHVDCQTDVIGDAGGVMNG